VLREVAAATSTRRASRARSIEQERFMRALLPSALLSLSLAACGDAADVGADTTGGPSSATFELSGTWDDNYGGSTVITGTTWGADTVVRFDNATNRAVVRAAADAAYNPSKFSLLAWTEPADGAFWLCTVDYGQDSADAAASTTKTADATRPAEAGCGGFPWTKMTKRP
jgi:hypothetical protein